MEQPRQEEKENEYEEVTESASGILSLAAEELVADNPELAVRLALRVCKYGKDKMLQRIVSRATIGAIPAESVLTLAQTCIGVIHYALPRVTASGEYVPQVFWVERLRVAMEVLSRLVLRLPPDTAKTILDVGLVCYRTPTGSAACVTWGAPNCLRLR